MTPRRLLLAGGAIVVAVGALWLWPGRARHRATETAAAPAEVAESSPLARRDYPSAPAAATPPPLPPPSSAAPAAPVQPPAPAKVITVGADRPAPPTQLASAWAIGYRDAVCACHTRTCVGDLQGRFVQQLGAMVQGDEQDDQRYSEATRTAIKCYNALPEGS